MNANVTQVCVMVNLDGSFQSLLDFSIPIETLTKLIGIETRGYRKSQAMQRGEGRNL